MSVLKTHAQREGEVKRYQLSYARWLAEQPAGTILKATSTTTDVVTQGVETPTPIDVTVLGFIRDDTVIEYVIAAGQAGITYNVNFSTSTYIPDEENPPPVDPVTIQTIQFRIV